jgi:hypothetical protein
MIKNSNSDMKVLMKMMIVLIQITMNLEDIYQYLYNQSRLEIPFPYFRFNIPRDIEDIGLEEWSRNDELGIYIDNYI